MESIQPKLSLTIAHINTCSIRNKLSDLIDILHDHKINILGVSETWLSSSDNDSSMNIPKYRFTRCDRLTPGGGVCIYYQEDLKAYPLSFPNPANLEMTALKLLSTGKQVIIICVYRPPCSPVAWWDHLITALGTLLNSNPCDELVVMGDFNVDTLKKTRSHHETHLRRLMSQYGLSQLNHAPTRYPTMSCIDLVMTSNTTDADTISTTTPLDLSDHFLVKVDFLSHELRPYRRTAICRNLRKIDLDKLKQDVQASSAVANPSLKSCVNPTWNDWVSSLLEIIDKQAPLRSQTITQNAKKAPKPWVNDELRSLYNCKKHAFRKAIKHPNDAKLKQEFKDVRARTDRLNTFLRNKYFLERCLSQRRDVRSHWRLINSIANRLKSRPPPAAEVRALNVYFHSIVTDPDRVPLQCPFGPELQTSFSSFKLITQLDVVRIISTLDATKASGPDQLPTSIIKSLAAEITPALTTLFNDMLQHGSLPSQFRMAHVTPVHKKGNPTLPENYRPISLLPVLSKVLERLVFDQLTQYIDRNPEQEVLPAEQFAYRRGHSTEDALSVAVDHWSRATDRGRVHRSVLCGHVEGLRQGCSSAASGGPTRLISSTWSWIHSS